MKQITLNLSGNSITNNETISRKVTLQEFWKEFLYLSRQDLSDKELEVLSNMLSDNELGRVPATVYKSLENKGYLVNKELSDSLVGLKERLVFDKYRIIFNYELYDS